MSFDAVTSDMRSTSIQEAFGDVVPFTDYPQVDWPDGNPRSSLVPFTNIQDRADGKFFPVFENEIDLAAIRGMSRRIMSMSPYMPAAITTLRTYTMGNGPTVQVCGRAKHSKPDDNTRFLQRIIDKVIEQIQLAPTLEELHDRSREEGEALHVLHRPYEDCLSTEIVEMDCLTQPGVTGDLTDWIRDEFGIDCDCFVPSWSFGILTGKRSTDQPLGYHVVYESNGADFEFYPASRVTHLKRNVPRNVKRGVSDWYQEFDDLRNEAKVARNIGVNTALQAAIAWIEEYASGATQAQALSTTPTDLLRQVPTNIGQGGGTRSQRATHYGPGTIVRTTEGRQYKPGPLGAERNGNFEIAVQMLLRRIGIRNQMPEYMISGDASNGNFASTIVAESPFVKAREADQEYMRRVTVSMLWKAVALVWTGMTGKPLEVLEQLKTAYEIKVEFPAVQTRDPLALAQRLEIEKRNGWVSDQTAMSELGRDPDQEKAQGAKAAEAPSPFGGLPLRSLPQPNQSLAEGINHATQTGQQPEDDLPEHQDGNGGGETAEAGGGHRAVEGGEETLREAFIEDDHPRDDNGRFVSKQKLAAAKANPKLAAELRAKVTDPAQRKKLDAAIGPEKKSEKPAKEAVPEAGEKSATSKRPAHEMTLDEFKKANNVKHESIGEARNAVDPIGSFVHAGEKVVDRVSDFHSYTNPQTGKTYKFDLIKTEHRVKTINGDRIDKTRYLAVMPGSDVPLAGIVYRNDMGQVVGAYNHEGKIGIIQKLLGQVQSDHGKVEGAEPMSAQGARAIHRFNVARALNSGIPVSAEVLKDYPNLKPAAVKESLTPAQSAALQGALESVETTDEARAILESIGSYP